MANTKKTKRTHKPNNETSDEIAPPKKSCKNPDFVLPPKQPKLFDLVLRKKLAKKLLKECKMPSTEAIVNKLKPLPKDERSPNFTYHRVENDGNSLYRSLSYLLFGEENYHNYVREVVINFMRRPREDLNEVCKTHTYNQEETIESYIRETRADKYSRLPNGFIELEAAALYFNVPIFLFTRSVNLEPNTFHLTNKYEDEGGFVLFNFNKYFRPVLTFDGENLEHTEVELNSNKITLKGNQSKISIGVNELDALSTTLCNDAIKFNPMLTLLPEESLNAIKEFTLCKTDEIDLDLKLFNFCCKHRCFPMIEILIDLFKLQKHVGVIQILASFIEGLNGEAKAYSQELTEHFGDMCFSASCDVLESLKLSTDQLKSLITSVLKCKRGYELSTRYIDVKLSDGSFAFKDIFPFTVLSSNSDKKTLSYFTGPRPEEQKWIQIIMNRRLMEDLDKIASSDHVLFKKTRFYVYNETENSIGTILNVFAYHQRLNYHALPRSSKKLESVHLVVSDNNEDLLVDKLSKQVYDLAHKEWLKVEDIIVVEETDDYEICAISIKIGKHNALDDHKRRVILRKPNSQSLFRWVDAFGLPHIPKIVFQVTPSRLADTLTVKKRLADSNITLNESKRFEEQQMLMYGQVNPTIHYVVPRPKDAELFALFYTDGLNEMVKAQLENHSSSHNKDTDTEMGQKRPPGRSVA